MAMYVFDQDKLEKMMKKKGINKMTLARMLSLSHTAVGKWGEDNNRPKCHNIERMTEIFNCSPNSFFSKL